MSKLVGIDIGGTSAKIGLFSQDGTMEGFAKVPTAESRGDELPARFVSGLEGLLAANDVAIEDVAGVGIDVPGPVAADGNVTMLPNLELDVVGLVDMLKAAFPQARVAVCNDVNAAALGELWQGSAKDAKDFVLVALGTGVGAGVVVDGKLVAGAFGAGGEMGHLIVNRSETEMCGCGKRGCLEQYASASGVVRVYRHECAECGITPVELDGPTDTLSVFEAYQAGDEAAVAAVSTMCDSLGFALAQVSNVIDPGLYLIGGGLGEGFDLFAHELRSAFRAYCLPSCAGTRILPASLGNKASMFGSAFLAMG